MVAIHQVCNERQLPVDTVLEAVEVALISAYKRNFSGNHSITAQIDPKSGEPVVYVERYVVDKIEDERNEILLDEARAIYPRANVGELISIESTPANFGRIAAQTAKQVILQRIREAERDALYSSYAEREGEVINGTVHKVDHNQVTLSLGNVEAILPKAEQIPTERYNEGQRLKAFVSSVSKSSRGPQIIVSRTHRNLLRRLLEVEVPEIFNGTVEIKSIAREAGFRSKVAVAALQEGVDPVGSCVGMRGTRIQNIVNELHGEKIDVVQWNPDIGYFIASALSPAKVMNVMLFDERGKTAMVVVPDKQLSLAIGKEGQNARLAAKLTGWRIDIKSSFEAATEVLERIKRDETLRERVSHRLEIFNMTTQILAEKSPLNFTEGELKLLSEAIEIANTAEMAIKRERKAKVTGEAKPAKRASDIDILARAEAILVSQSRATIKAALIEEEPEPDAPLSELDILAMSIFSDAVESISEQPMEKNDLTETEVEPIQAEESKEESLDLMTEAKALLAEKELPKVETPKVETPWSEEEDEALLQRQKDKKKERLKKRQLVYNEALGEVITERRRKGSRQETRWTDYKEDE